MSLFFSNLSKFIKRDRVRVHNYLAEVVRIEGCFAVWVGGKIVSVFCTERDAQTEAKKHIRRVGRGKIGITSVPRIKF